MAEPPAISSNFAYDDGAVFFGFLRNSAMDKGVVYDASRPPSSTMLNGLLGRNPFKFQAKYSF